MKTDPDTSATLMVADCHRASAIEQFRVASGLSAQSPTDEETAMVIRGVLGAVIGNDRFGEPAAQDALLRTARLMRALFGRAETTRKD